MKSNVSRSGRATGRATLADVARVAAVSPMTASRALRGASTVDAALAERVTAAARTLGYVPDPAARALASHRSSHVAVLIPSLTNRLFVELLEAAQHTLRQGGFQTLIGITHYDPVEEEQLVREQLLHRPAGLLLTGLDQSKATRKLIKSSETPCVTMMEIDKHAQAFSVGFSQTEAAAAMTQHLLGRGHKRIAFAAAQLDARTLQRLQGWRDTLSACGRHDARLEWLDQAPSSVELGARMFEQIVAAKPRVDAIFFCNDDLAHGALLHALRMGIEVPGRIAVAGFNDLAESAQMVPPLTTILTPRTEVGREAAQVLLSLMNKQRPAIANRDLGFELVVRQST
ncbi:MAG: LacI family DNA-binding transcriptional regulator [Rhodoferax sp.]|nr:LacI family DNA-binding transcriptional regulator [Rhodoferax sp.]